MLAARLLKCYVYFFSNQAATIDGCKQCSAPNQRTGHSKINDNLPFGSSENRWESESRDATDIVVVR